MGIGSIPSKGKRERVRGKGNTIRGLQYISIWRENKDAYVVDERYKKNSNYWLQSKIHVLSQRMDAIQHHEKYLNNSEQYGYS